MHSQAQRVGDMYSVTRVSFFFLVKHHYLRIRVYYDVATVTSKVETLALFRLVFLHPCEILPFLNPGIIYHCYDTVDLFRASVVQLLCYVGF